MTNYQPKKGEGAAILTGIALGIFISIVASVVVAFGAHQGWWPL